jgi:hypothetical protein
MDQETSALRLRCQRQERQIEALRRELERCRAVIEALAEHRQVTISDGPPPRPPVPRLH